MKSKFTATDVRCIVLELQAQLVGMRAANIYDVNPKTYVIKFAQQDNKQLLLLESGIRIHTTNFERDKSLIPSGFTMKLRKHLRTRRLEKVEQLGMDRIVDMTFGSGEQTHHLILELYAQGNVILTDGNYSILTLLRTHKHEETVKFCVGEKYPMSLIRDHVVPSRDWLSRVILPDMTANTQLNIKNALNAHLDFGPQIIEHCLSVAGIKQSAKLPDASLEQLFQGGDVCSVLCSEFQQLENTLTVAAVFSGYIFLTQPKLGKSDSENSNEPPLVVYSDFGALPLRQFEKVLTEKFGTFNEAVDTYFTKSESQRLQVATAQQENAARARLEKVRVDQRGRVDALQTAAEESRYKAMLIEHNHHMVDEVISTLQQALAAGMDWDEIWHLVRENRKAGDPIASLIHSLDLPKNQATLMLSGNLEDADSDTLTAPTTLVTVDIGLGAHNNARQFYVAKKKSEAKGSKTRDVAQQALKAAEAKTREELNKIKITATIKEVRKRMWFEKFNWFISSENFLVVGGRDAQQNELVVKRHLREGDLYVHADITGAASCVIKNPSKTQVSPRTLTEAGCFCVCHSSAWTAKVICSAWYVDAHQVSKTAPTGEFLTTGSFMIRGKKTFLPPSPPIMGFGYMFKLEESCVARHLEDRKPRHLDGSDTAATADYDTITDVTGFLAGTDNNNDDNNDNDKDSSDSDENNKDNSANNNIDNNIDNNNNTDKINDNNDSNDDDDDDDDVMDFGIKAPVVKIGPLDPKTVIETEVKAKGSKPSVKERKMMKKMNLGLAEVRAILESRPPEPQQEVPEPKQVQNVQPTTTKRGNARHNKDNEEEKILREALLHGEDMSTVMSKIAALHDPQHQPEESQKPQKQQKPDEKNNSNKKNNQKDKTDKNTATTPKLNPKQQQLQNKQQQLNQKQNQKQQIQQQQQQQQQQYQQQQQQQYQQQQQQQYQQQQQQQQQQQPQLQPQDVPDVQDATEPQELDATGDKAKRPTRAEKNAIKRQEEMEIQQILREENLDQLDENLDILVTLTGQPISEDILMFAVPVCAPYAAMHNFKFKAKLTPGTQKKSKAAKQALEIFLRGECSARERELIKQVGDNEVAEAMIADVKLSTPGLQSMKQQLKSAKKKKN